MLDEQQSQTLVREGIQDPTPHTPGKTKQVYNLFQDLWSQSLFFSERF